MSEIPDGWSVDVDGEKVVVNFPVEGDYGHRVLSRHQARVLRTQLHLAYLLAERNDARLNRQCNLDRGGQIKAEGVASLYGDTTRGSIDAARLVCRKLVMRSSVDVRSSAGSGDADASAPNAAQFAVKQVVGSTKTITVADQLHLSRFACQRDTAPATRRLATLKASCSQWSSGQWVSVRASARPSVGRLQ